MSATDGSELMIGKIIYIGSDHLPSGRVHYSYAYLEENIEILECEIKRLDKNLKNLDSKDKEYLTKMKKIKFCCK
jgi:hypothetical protein